MISCDRPVLKALGLYLLLMVTAAAGHGEGSGDTASGAAEADPTAALPQEHREWLERVELLITDEERAYFVGLDEEFRRLAFIEQFWQERDPDELTRWNELKIEWEELIPRVRSLFGSEDDVRARYYLLHGPPKGRCLDRFKELELWVYGWEDDPFPVIFYKVGRSAPYVAYVPPSTLAAAIRSRPAEVPLAEQCKESHIERFQRIIDRDIYYEPDLLPPLERPQPSAEWVASFASQTTDLPAGAATFGMEAGFEFPGRHQQRTVVQGILEMDRGEISSFAAGDEAYRQFLLIGELVKDDMLFERFRLRFEVPVAAETDEPLALVFQRYLRPGDFRLLVKLEDVYGRRFARADLALEVPSPEHQAPAEVRRWINDSELLRFLSEANAATERGERSLRLLPPSNAVLTGLVRFTTLAVGDFDRMDFLIDEELILAKKKEPYSVELDLGDVPAPHRVRVNGYDAGGRLLATDEIHVNPGGQSFRVRLTEPQRGREYGRSLRAAVQVIVPDGHEVERVEVFLNEARLATLYQPPYVQPILLGREKLAYVRTVAFLRDGNSAEDLVFVNAPENFEEISVHFVELYATVHDKTGWLVRGLGESDFLVYEDGVLQSLRRFEFVDDLPLHTVLLIDTSASMEESLESVGEAARTFVEQAVDSRDRASVISFNDMPEVEARFTNDVALLSHKLKGLRATGGTALFDSLIYALHYFHGVRGQKALLLLSDGQDESSRFEFESTLEFARRAGVTVYAIGLDKSELDRPSRRVLRDLAGETGGRAFFVGSTTELPAIYASIEHELRSQYLLAYQSTSDKDPSEFRSVQVVVAGQRLEVRTMSGYYP